MRLEKVSLPTAKEPDNQTRYSIPLASQAQPFDQERLASLLFYLINPTTEIQTSVLSIRNILKKAKSQENHSWTNKISLILQELGISDPKIYRKILTGQEIHYCKSPLSPPAEINAKISYLFKHITHPEAKSKINFFLASIDKNATFNDIALKDCNLIYQFGTLLYLNSPDTLIQLFSALVADNLSEKSISDVIKFIQAYENFLKIIPNGKLLHIVYSRLHELISGNRGAKVLAEYCNDSMIADCVPENITGLYMLCDQKDLFEKFHAELCIGRLLNSEKLELEVKVCEQIRENSGPDSMELTFSILKNTADHTIESDKMNVIITTNKLISFMNLPHSIKQEYKPKQLPDVFASMIAKYLDTFKELYKKKVLKFHFLSSIIELSYGDTTLKCNFIQALILFMFNQKSRIKEKEIIEYLETDVLTEDMIKEELKSLKKILNEDQGTYRLENIEDSFINLLIKSQVAEEDEDDSLNDMRKYIIECFIVKLLKVSKQLDLNVIIEKLNKNLKFLPEHSQITLSLASLEKKGYVWKVDK